MATLQPAPTNAKKNRSYRAALRIDMTPLVDLGFLLITFFVFTSSLSSSAAMQLAMPADGPPTNTAESATLTVMLSGNNELYAYSGFWADALAHDKVIKTDYSITSGIGTIIRQKQKELLVKGKKDDLILLIKPDTASSYKNVVDMLDEAAINVVKRYAIVSPDAAEEAYMAQQKQRNAL